MRCVWHSVYAFISEKHIVSLFIDGLLDPVKDGSTARNLTDANEHCRSNGYELLSIHNDDQMDAAEQVCGSGWCWIGLVMDETTGEWSWTDGTKLDYGFDGDGNPTKGVWPWRSGEPSFSNSNEFSTRLIVGKGWNDFYENVSDHPIMCNNGTLAPTVEPTPGMCSICFS